MSVLTHTRCCVVRIGSALQAEFRRTLGSAHTFAYSQPSLSLSLPLRHPPTTTIHTPSSATATGSSRQTAMRPASISTSLVAGSCLLWLTLAAMMLPASVQSAATSSDKATHDGLRKLTAANFTLTNQGAWLIEFFSPNCIHCKRFGATWSELSQNKDHLRTQYPQAPFTLAQVDCLAQWDLCKAQGVTFLPRLTVYQDGKQNPEEYNKGAQLP